MMGFVWVVYFAIGAVWTVTNPSRGAYDRYIVPYIPLATLICLLGYLMLLVGYYAPWPGRVKGRKVEEYPRGALFMVVPAVLGFIGFLSQHLVYRAQKLGFGVASIISSMGQLAPLFVFAWALAWLMLLSGKATRWVKWLLIGALVPGSVVVALNSMNSKATVVSLALVPLMAWWYAKRRVPWVTLTVLLLIVVFVVFPFNNTFRNLDNRISTTKRLELTSSIIGDWSTYNYFDRSVGTFLSRMALINSVAVVLRDVPRWEPYAMGRTIFIPTMVFFVPRVIWPDKPTAEFGREFGETFRVVHILDAETNVAATIPGELYWNFSLPGVLIGMGLWGLVLRWYYRHYGESTDLDPIRRAVHMLLLIQFLHFEAGIAQPSVMVIRTLIVLEAYRFVARRFGLTRRIPGSAAPIS